MFARQDYGRRYAMSERPAAQKPSRSHHPEPRYAPPAQPAYPPQEYYEQLPAPPTRSKATFWSLCKHCVMVALLCGCGFAYQKYQDMQAPVDTLVTDKNDELADWNLFDDAPGFSGSREDAPAFGATPVEAPIPIQEDFISRSPVATETNGWDTNTVSQTDSGGVSIRNSSTTQEKSGSKHKSIWDEPAVSTISQMNPSTEEQIQIPETKKPNYSFADAVPSPPEITDSEKKSPFDISQIIPDPKSMIPEVPENPLITGIWRQFEFGSGEDAVVCIFDPSVSQNPQVFAPFFASIKEQWQATGTSNSALHVLMTQANDQASERAINSRIKELNPTRIIRVSQNGADQGTLKFSSARESMDALLAVPSNFQVTQSSGEKTYFNNRGKQIKTVYIDLPQELNDQLDDSQSMMLTALSGSWSAKPKSSTRQETTSNFGIPVDLPESIDSPFERETSQPTKTKKSSGFSFLPSPTEKSKKPASNGFSFAPEPPKSNQFESTDDYIASLYSGETPEEKQDVATKFNQPTESTMTEEFAERKPRYTRPVQLLDPPPIYQIPSSKRTNSRASFFRLPPPPVNP